LLRFSVAERRLELGVHDLIEAGPRRGDLRLQVAWSARTRMRAGQRVHSEYQTRRAAEDNAFRKEVVIRHALVIRGWDVLISGRIDGLTQSDGMMVVEEIKSSTLPGHMLETLELGDFPAWRRQVELYLHFLSAQGRSASGELVVISVVDGAICRLPVPEDPGLSGYIEAQLDWLVYQQEQSLAWQTRRRTCLETGFPFAHERWRDGQEGLADELRRLLEGDQNILLQAPTGYGKTAAALHAALRVAYEKGRRVFFATARTTQQRMAEDTVEAMAARGLPIRAVSIRSKEKICINEDKLNCHPDSCPYASRYHDKLQAGDLIQKSWSQGGEMGGAWPDSLVLLSEEHMVCPYALSMDLAGQADLVIGDYNYLFDPSVRLASISAQLEDWILIIDEVHNLPDRAMGYGSPSLSLLGAWQAMQAMERFRQSEKFAAPMRKTVDLLLDGLAGLSSQEEEAFPLEEGLDRRALRELVDEVEEMALDYAMAKLDLPLWDEGVEDSWLGTAWSILRLHSALERAGEETIGMWRKGSRDRRRDFGAQMQGVLFTPQSPAKDHGTGLKLLCRDPSALLGRVLAKAGGSIGMSATLQPFDFYQSMLGLSPETCHQRVYPSTFPQENRAAYILPQVSTAYRHRERDSHGTAKLISSAVRGIPGNVAVFFSSFAFRDLLLPLLDLGDKPMILQQPRMAEGERAQILKTLRLGEGHVLLGVMGGIFSEGIDLPSSALLGVVVVGPSLPQANLSRRLMQAWHEERYGQGFRYAWLVPGMARVSQAAGRVIRGPEDRGTLVLIGRRFLQSQYLDFLPSDWDPVRSTDIGADLSSFWDILSNQPDP
jgi:DNA excision repair protein ERCC-2